MACRVPSNLRRERLWATVAGVARWANGHRERGQVLVIGAIALTAVLAFAALIVHLGFLLGQRRALQNASDAAALAATRALLDEHTSRSFRDPPVRLATERLVTQNGLVLASVLLQAAYVDPAGTELSAVGLGGSFPASATGVRVSLSAPFTSLLGPFLGASTIQLTRDAVVQLRRSAFPSASVIPVPLAVPLAAFLAGSAYDLYDQSVALASYGVSGYLPYLHLAHSANTGPGYLAATDFGDMNVNLQYWSDGQQGGGTLTAGSRIALAPGSYGAYVRAGLLDNVRRQGLIDGSGASYALLGVPLWNTYLPASLPGDPNLVELVGFATFKIVAAEIQLATLQGYFVPSWVQFANYSPAPGPMWGPSVTMLAR